MSFSSRSRSAPRGSRAGARAIGNLPYSPRWTCRSPIAPVRSAAGRSGTGACRAPRSGSGWRRPAGRHPRRTGPAGWTRPPVGGRTPAADHGQAVNRVALRHGFPSDGAAGDRAGAVGPVPRSVSPAARPRPRRPASRWVTSSAMTSMQSAPASQDSRCEPGPPQGATVPATVSR